ncbi:MAG: hypothetical protein E5X94_00560 [Mesorhizobium sp.]|uniref:hypothetical protein n=1 Tax=unclassified Mesorhizobium TaxID=325217 RepID=UPI00122841B7|nr:MULTISPECIES: hypothetical protein [unclassified Mesorhizobium]TIN82744.1 MAG: hypothetical protein E5X97_28990 [Mesorhizobium sp.]TIN88330.1 MAG: hypothetical protein E5X94_00560 [Mesorhizobium sp.]
MKLLASGQEVHAPLSALGSLYQPLDADLTSWAAISRAAGFDTFATTPSSANLRALLTDETGTGAAVFATSPVLVTPNLGTPSALTLTNATGSPASIGLANGTGLPVSTGISGFATGMATFLAGGTSAQLAAAVTDETGSGALVFATSPTLVTPNIGAATGTSAALSVAPQTGPALNVAGNSQNITSGSEISLSNNSGLLLLNENGATGVVGLFLCGGGVVTKIGGDASYVVSSTPTTSQIGVYYDGAATRYKVKNGFASTKNLGILWIATRNSV